MIVPQVKTEMPAHEKSLKVKAAESDFAHRTETEPCVGKPDSRTKDVT